MPQDKRRVRLAPGEVFTREWVVELILDLAGYTAAEDLAEATAVEPSCGAGAFLVPMVRRLVASCRRSGVNITSARNAIAAFDLRSRNVELARKAVTEVLVQAGVMEGDAEALVAAWVNQGDFLDPGMKVPMGNWVLGNPPYIRPEDVGPMMEQYRRSWSTMRGRSDIYVGFIERALRSLHPGGRLGFIVSDRWMRNAYGDGLRRLVADGYSVEAVVGMHDVDAFESRVAAYPAVVVVRKASQQTAVVAEAKRSFDRKSAERLSRWAGGTSRYKSTPAFEAHRLPGWFDGSGSWPTGSPRTLAMVAGLERHFPPLEDPATGTRVGIGVATGADDVFITDKEGLVEAERMLPLILGRHTTSGVLRWGQDRRWLVNPWGRDGLVDLADWPRLAAHFEANADLLTARHTVRKLAAPPQGGRPKNWYRTIDRVDVGLTGREKLLLPDIKASIHPVLDEGAGYPHHNLYWVASTGWDIELLGGLLLSEIANTFVATYSVRMANGCLRFMAAYLRRIRVPRPESIAAPERRALQEAFRYRDVERATGVATKVYGLTL